MMDTGKIRPIQLACLPTPLEPAPGLAAAIGLKTLLIKRDDLTGLAGGGNKVRKLEYSFAQILSGDFDTVITAGGIQSNHARLTAAAACRAGLDCKLVLGGPDFDQARGNLLLDQMLDAEIRYLVDDDANRSLEREMENWAAELISQGKKPYILPIGGSTGLGALGYVQAMKELAGQLVDKNIQLIVGVGSCGTFAGMLLGAVLYLPQARIIGISVSRSALEISDRSRQLFYEAAALLELDGIEAGPIECYDNYHHIYGEPTRDGELAIQLAARREGLLLDSIYTGKVMAGLIDLTRRKSIDARKPVVFVHTGGFPIIFAGESGSSPQLKITKIYRK